MEIGFYEKFQKIGEGSYRVVYKARDTDTGRCITLKKIRLENETEAVPTTATPETSLPKEPRHPNGARLLDVLPHYRRLYLVFECMSEDLKMHTDRAASCKAPPAADLVEGVAYCHSHSILHRDLKPQNLPVDVEGNIKLDDFGLGRAFAVPLRPYTDEVVITFWYRRTCARDPVGCALLRDFGRRLRGIGCVLAEIPMLRALFPGESEIDQLFSIFRTIATPDEKTWPARDAPPRREPQLPVKIVTSSNADGQDFILELPLQANQDDPLVAKYALRHRYFNDVNIQRPERV